MHSRTYLRGEELLATPVLIAVILTAINDHILKGLYPGPITWKISDFSGLFFIPFLLSAILGDLRWVLRGAIAAGALFTILKLTGFHFGPVHIAQDVTDLVALPVLVAAVVYAKWRWPCAFSLPS